MEGQEDADVDCKTLRKEVVKREILMEKPKVTRFGFISESHEVWDCLGFE